MADEPRRSGRATKGQHKNASSSPAPQPKPTKQAKSKPAKKSIEPANEPEYDDEDEKIRCICGDDNPKDKRAFIGCEACEVWQHNVCMGMPDDEDDVPEHYFCEECQPEEHSETLQALAKGEKIWEARNKIYQNEKKMGAKRKKSGPSGWLKRDVSAEGEDEEVKEEEEEEEKEEEAMVEEPPETTTGSKRKRGEESGQRLKDEDIKAEPEEKNTRASRQDKRHKSIVDDSPPDVETALVDIDQLPSDRKKIAVTLSKIIADEVSTRAKSGSYRIPDGETPKSLGDYHGSRIEYALTMEHGAPNNANYGAQFRMLYANFKNNKMLVARLLDGSLSADQLSTMDSKDMASDELQKERAVMKEQLDRQAVAVQEEGPRYRRTHKGDELIEDENKMLSDSGGGVQPVRERATEAASPTTEQQQAVSGSPEPLRVDTAKSQSNAPGLEHQRRTSSQQFDMNSIWAKTAQSPTSASAPRPLQMPPRRRSSVQQPQQDASGTKEDADVDRMLQDDDDETYSPADYTDPDGIVWRGKLIQSADGVSPSVNARFVAGRDLAPTVAWRDLLPSQLSIDGRLQVGKAEEYLCSLQWSQSSDVSVLSFTPYDDAEGFEAVFQYFKSRQRYAVVNKDKPPMVKDLYIIPVDAGQELPSHVNMLEFNRLGGVVGEKCLLASLVVGRAVGTPPIASNSATSVREKLAEAAANGQHTNIPQHIRASAAPGPAGSPLQGMFSPPTNSSGGTPATLPPNPYSQPQHANPLVGEILGNLQYAPTAQQVVGADPHIAREKLEHLKRIMEEDPRTRTDIEALASKLFAGD